MCLGQNPLLKCVMLLAVLNLNRWLSSDTIGCSLVKPFCYLAVKTDGRRQFLFDKFVFFVVNKTFIQCIAGTCLVAFLPS